MSHHVNAPHSWSHVVHCCTCPPPGVQLEALSNGISTADNTQRDTTYTPSHTSSAHDQQQQQQQSEGCTAASRRPRRVIRAPERLINSQIGGYGAVDRDDHDMVRCDGY